MRNHHSHGADHDRVHHTPAWMRLHHDWRFWIAVILMFAAMMIYVTSGDLAWRPRLQPQSGAVGK